jgi:hypothetical protein
MMVYRHREAVWNTSPKHFLWKVIEIIFADNQMFLFLKSSWLKYLPADDILYANTPFFALNQP